MDKTPKPKKEIKMINIRKVIISTAVIVINVLFYAMFTYRFTIKYELQNVSRQDITVSDGKEYPYALIDDNVLLLRSLRVMRMTYSYYDMFSTPNIIYSTSESEHFTPNMLLYRFPQINIETIEVPDA